MERVWVPISTLPDVARELLAYISIIVGVEFTDPVWANLPSPPQPPLKPSKLAKEFPSREALTVYTMRDNGSLGGTSRKMRT